MKLMNMLSGICSEKPVKVTLDQYPTLLNSKWERHPGKMRNWFPTSTRWNVVLLEPSEVAKLVFLESDWTKQEGLVVPAGPDYRLLDSVAERAMNSTYFDRPTARRHKAYYDALTTGDLSIAGDERIAICTAEASEIPTNPSAQYYLLDGVGRCLPYTILAQEGRFADLKIEAFLAERTNA